ncbi:hypothetical protein HF313_25355 [Massilia atriviolacea]|uniref:Uncharacterized protein n=1 Tax=Massilia atriviolacea TaxID=2495579 RepID=A0A430HNB7_9BURK|nr:hypothetical protein [Massilia atriviolacea]RSZ58991.1 hypothetical protein EJB06_11720 [Massilia atriviolacea]
MSEVDKVLAQLAAQAARAQAASQRAAAGGQRYVADALAMINAVLPVADAAIDQLRVELAAASGSVGVQSSTTQGEMVVLTFDVTVPYGNAGMNACTIKLRANSHGTDAVSAEVQIGIGGLRNFFSEVIPAVSNPGDFDPVFAGMIAKLSGYVSPLK